jgi:hypothetical protein
MTSFAKLNGSFIITDYQEREKRISYGQDNSDSYSGIKYMKINTPSRADIFKVIPEEHHKHFGLSVMRINSRVPPHTDSYIKCCINFYMVTENCVTQFWEPAVETPRSYQINNQADGFMFLEADLKPIDRFIASPSEAWVLNVKKPHSVFPLSVMLERRAITLGTKKFTFDEVCEMLKQTGYLD